MRVTAVTVGVGGGFLDILDFLNGFFSGAPSHF